MTRRREEKLSSCLVDRLDFLPDAFSRFFSLNYYTVDVCSKDRTQSSTCKVVEA